MNDQREHPSSSPPVYVSQSVSTLFLNLCNGRLHLVKAEIAILAHISRDLRIPGLQPGSSRKRARKQVGEECERYRMRALRS